MTREMKRIQLLGVADTVRRTWWILVSGICAGLIGAVALLNASPKQYEASAHLLATTAEHDASITLDALRTRLAAVAQSALARGRSQSAVAEALGIDPEKESISGALASVRTRLHVAVTTHTDNPAASDVLIRYRDNDPKIAANLTNTVANLFISENARNEPSGGATSDALLQLEMSSEAVRPSRPVRTGAILAYGFGVLAGPLLWLGWLCVRRLVNPVLDTMASVQEAAEIRVLVGIPQITTATAQPARAGRGRNMLYSAISVAILAVVMLMWA
jgi:hypothetical protein